MRLNKKIVSILSILSLLLTMLPLQIFAAGGVTGNTISQQRLGGADRYQTAAAITGAGWSFAENVIIGGGGDDHLVDSLAAAPLTQLLNAPILITESGRLTEVTAAELQRLGVKTAYLVSGDGVISASVQNELRALGIDLVQLGGADRFATAYNIAQEVAKYKSIDTVVVTTAYTNADALTIASIAAVKGWPVLLAGPDGLTGGLQQIADQASRSYVIGGTGAVSAETEASLPAPTRLGGVDRYATNLAILDYFADQFNYGKGLFVANGADDHLVDALSASAYIAGAPLLISANASLSAAELSLLANIRDRQDFGKIVTALGGTGSVFDTTLSSVYAALYKAAEDTVAENDTPLIEDNTLVVEETEVPLGGGSGGGSSGGGGYSYGSGGGSDSGNSGNSGNSNNGGGDNTGGVNLEPTITVATAFVSGETTQYAVDVTYTATASAGASVSEVSYSINGGAAEYLYLRGGDGVSAKGTLGAGRVLLTPDENSIVFTVKDTAGKTAVFAVAEKPVYVFGTTPEYDDQYISASATNEGWQYVTNRIVAFAQSGVSDELIYAAVSGIDGTIVGRVNVIDMYFIQFESSLSEAELTAKCEALTTGDAAVFESAVLDLISSATVEAAPTNDPWWNVANRQWGLDAIQAPEAWASYGGYFRDVKVGVSDNGFLNTHEDLQIPASNVFNRFLGSDDHGTHVIGTIGAVQNNNKGLAGVVNARRSDLYGYDVFTLTDDGVQGARTPEAMEIAGLAWNVQHGAKVINYSIGRDEGTNWASRSAHYNSYYGLAMNKLLDGGYDFVVVNAAGNDAVDANRNGGFVGVTDSEWVSRIIVVGATDKNGDIASFSNYGGRVDVVAPGVDIYSTIATSSTAYANYQGTSMAAPHVTGVAALVWAANPGISGTQVKQIIVDSANESGLAVEDTRGGSIPRQTYHQVNAKAAVAKAIGETPALTAGRLAGKIVNAANTDVGIGGAVIALYSGINDPPVRTTTSGTDGQYVIDNIATGRYYLTIAADGYVPETGFVQIEAGVTTFFHQLNAVPASSENGTVSGSVINAFTGSVVSGTAITLDFRRGIDYNPDSPGNIVGTTTAANGAYAISLPAGNYTVTASGDGYITTKAYVYALGGQSVANQNVVISPVFEEGAMGAVRIVLTWGELPSDLDSHLVGPAAGGGDFHIYFGDQNYGSYANLDVDDVTSYGPETVTINTLFDGTYDYYVHDFTNRSSTTSDYLRNSQAVVRIYSSDNELLRTFNVPTGGGASTIWSVFSLEVTDGVYRIVPVNTMHNEVTSASNVGRRSTQDYENGNEAYPEYPGVDENPFGSYDAYLGEEEDIIGDGTEEYPDFLGAESLLGEEGLIGGAEEPFPLSQE